MADAALSRLEAVTARLEALESKLAAGAGQGYATRSAATSGTYTPATRSITSAGAPAAAPLTGGPVESLQQLITQNVEPFMQIAAQLSAPVQKASNIVKQAFDELKTVVAISMEAKRPSQSEFPSLLEKLSEQLSAATALTEGRRTDEFNHNKTVGEALQSFCFVLYTDPSCGMAAPAEHVAQSWQTAEFYGNKISVQYRNSDTNQVEWVKSLKACFTQLRTLVQHHFPQGLSWKAGGLSLEEAKLAVKKGVAGAPSPISAAPPPAAAPAPVPAPAPAGGAPPPPPPPPPPSLAAILPPELPSTATATSKPAGGMSDVFSSLNKGENVTAGLKKVSDDMKSKNRADRTGKVEVKSTKPASKPTKTKGGPPRLELETASRKWVVEHQQDNRELIIADVNPQQTVYIYDCHDCVVQIQGKVNSVAVDGCSKTGVVLTDVVAQVEAVNCNSIQIQCTGSVPTISVEKVDGCQLYVSEATSKNPDFQLVTAKSSAMNIVVVVDNSEEEPTEVPIPEQFISRFVEGKLVTSAASHAGA